MSEMNPGRGKSKKKLDKIVKYIRQNRPERVREYSKKNKLEKFLKEVTGDDGKNLLHICCGYGNSGSLFRYLIKHGVDPIARDFHGNLPVHCALQQAINSDDPVRGWSVYTELIKPLSDAYPHTLKESNNNGSAVADLITRFLHKEDFSTTSESSSQSSDYSEEEEEEEEEDYDEDDSAKWNEKLAEEVCDEYSSYWGRYEQDFADTSSHPETYDQWADRIWSERKRKRDSSVFARWRESIQRNWLFGRKMSEPRHRTNFDNRSSRAKDAKWTGNTGRSYSHHHQQQQSSSETSTSTSPTVKRHSPKLADFLLSNKKYDALLKNNKETPLAFSNIPWPRDGSGAVITAEALEKMNIGENKMLLRKLQRRWHPDKFTQHFGDRLLKSDRDRILDQVNDIAKAFNSMARKIP